MWQGVPLTNCRLGAGLVPLACSKYPDAHSSCLNRRAPKLLQPFPIREVSQPRNTPHRFAPFLVLSEMWRPELDASPTGEVEAAAQNLNSASPIELCTPPHPTQLRPAFTVRESPTQASISPLRLSQLVTSARFNRASRSPGGHCHLSLGSLVSEILPGTSGRFWAWHSPPRKEKSVPDAQRAARGQRPAKDFPVSAHREPPRLLPASRLCWCSQLQQPASQRWGGGDGIFSPGSQPKAQPDCPARESSWGREGRTRRGKEGPQAAGDGASPRSCARTPQPEEVQRPTHAQGTLCPGPPRRRCCAEGLPSAPCASTRWRRHVNGLLAPAQARRSELPQTWTLRPRVGAWHLLTLRPPSSWQPLRGAPFSLHGPRQA